MEADPDTPGPSITHGGPGRVGTAAAVSALLACLAVLTAGAAWRVSGGRWAVIETPSMGRAAPVGPLVLIRPRPVDQLQVGDIVTYRPPTTPDRWYTHRIVDKLPDGTLQTQFDINGAPDPYTIDQPHLVGQVVTRWQGVGWLGRARPTILLSGVVLVVATGRYVPLRWRSTVRVLGVCLLFAVTSLLLRPFVHPILVGVTDTPDGQRATVVSGGLLPIQVTGVDGGHVDLSAGETGVVRVAAQQAGGALTVNASPHLTGWSLVTVTAVSLLPMLWCTLVGVAREDEDRGGDA